MAADADQPFHVLMQHTRRRAGLSVEELASRAQVHPKSVASWERLPEDKDSRIPYESTLATVIKVLNLPADDAMALMSARATADRKKRKPTQSMQPEPTPSSTPVSSPSGHAYLAWPIRQRVRGEMLVGLAVLLAVAFGAPLAVSHILTGLLSPTTPPLTLRLAIPTIQGWVTSGVELTPGMRLEISSRGRARSGNNPMPPWTAEGNPACMVVNQAFISRVGFPAPTLPCWSLIGRIGTGPPFEVGTHTTLNIRTAGELYLRDNDDFLGDNSGAWAVTMTVQK